MSKFPNPSTQFKPGTSGNRGGRPKKHSMQAALGQLLDANPEILRSLIDKGIQEAINGDFRYWKEIYDRLDGKVASSIEISDKPQVDWAAIDNECDTPPRQTVDPKGAKPVPASRKAGSPVVARTLGGVPPGAGQGDDR
jgi:hypothetical protein